jgi:hypothetical protein
MNNLLPKSLLLSDLIIYAISVNFIQDSVIFDGYQIYHNYFRPHLELDGKTPAEASGIKIKGQNKWITLIQNASNSQ